MYMVLANPTISTCQPCCINSIIMSCKSACKSVVLPVSFLNAVCIITRVVFKCGYVQ